MKRSVHCLEGSIVAVSADEGSTVPVVSFLTRPEYRCCSSLVESTTFIMLLVLAGFATYPPDCSDCKKSELEHSPTTPSNGGATQK